MEEFFKQLNAIRQLNSDEMNAIGALITVKKLEKGDMWLEEGKRASLMGFIQKGYLRKYYIKDGVEVTDYFYLENSFTGDIPSIVSKSPSIANMVAMEPTTILCISYANMDMLCNKYHNIEHIMRVMIEHAFITFYYRSFSFISSSPKERYAKLMEEQPQVLQRVAQYHIASFLGITPVHLSRLRAEK